MKDLEVMVARRQKAKIFFETHDLTDEPPEEFTGRKPKAQKQEL